MLKTSTRKTRRCAQNAGRNLVWNDLGFNKQYGLQVIAELRSSQPRRKIYADDELRIPLKSLLAIPCVEINPAL